MASCRIVNAAVESSVANIRTISTSYQTAGENFISDLTKAIAEMEGETKDALQNFIDTDVKTFVEESVSTALTGMADLLEANRTNFLDVDKQIADSISGS